MVQPASSPPDRLPWLSEIPRIGLKPEPERSRFPWAAVAIGLAFAFIAVAAYLLGFRNAGVGTEARSCGDRGQSRRTVGASSPDPRHGARSGLRPRADEPVEPAT